MGIRAWIAAVALLAACGDNLEPDPDPDTVLRVSLDTLTPTQVAAGDTISITCTLHENNITTMVQGEIRVVDEAKVARVGSKIVARKVGMIAVRCELPARGLVDTTPAIIEIVAGAAANVVTTVTPDPVVAGNQVTATCEVYDDYGNLIEGEMPSLELAPVDAANTIHTDLTAEMIRAGHYIASCILPGTTSNNVGFDVVPNLPASIVLSRAPDLSVYALNQTIQILSLVSDRYGNQIFDAVVNMTSSPITGVGPTIALPPDSFQYGGEGRYLITATVAPPTDLDATVSATIEVLINSKGPAISCLNDATMLNLTPGSTMTVSGQANDVNGVTAITVNGSAVTFDSSGNFSTSITTRFGMNFVDVSAIDSFGEPTTKVCTFLVSNRYALAGPIPDTLSLKLTQAAVDDGNRGGAITSLGDILHAVVNSQGLKDAVHNALLAANPLKPSSCDSQTCVFGVCVCWYSSEVTYISSQFDGPHSVSLALVNGGLAAVARFDNVHVKLRVRGKVSGISYDTTGWVNVSYVEIRLTLDTAISNGLPRITVRPGSVSASVGTITTDFNGVDGWIINNIVVPLAQGTLRDALRNVIQSFVVNNFNGLLDGLISGLNIDTLGTSFSVPKLGGGSVTLGFGIGFSSLSTTSSRMLFGIGTRFTAPILNAYPSLGVPLPPGVSLSDMSLSSPQDTGVAAHVGVFNGALHTLWRGNYFAAALTGTQLGGSLPAGLSLSVTTRLPPVAMISSSNVVQLHLGALDLMVQHPDLPPDLSVRLGAEAHASVTLVGNDLVFGSIVIDAIHASTDVVNLDSQQQQALQTMLAQIAQQFVNQSLNNSLPALPIPSFNIPTSMSTYGLPAGQQLGINSPTLSVAPQHFTLRGQFGIHP